MDLREQLSAAGYIARREELLALRAALASPGPAVLLLQGAPGTGKTALSKAVSQVLGAPYLYRLLHAWSGEEELYRGVDVAAAVAGAASHVIEPGVLMEAARLSWDHHPVVLCLDEIDKAPPRAEGLLLDFLQSGRVPAEPGRQIQARVESLLVFLTSNDSRPLGEALLRRCRRIQMRPLPKAVELELLKKAGVPTGAAAIIVKMAAEIRSMGTSCPSLQEMLGLGQDLIVAESAKDVEVLAVQRLVKDQAEVAVIKKLSPILWGEYKASMR